ncbi:MAG TPA: hypothetical protein V6D03_08385, partial [Candidatus Caenarcaniphilales bacterium]
MTSRAILRQAEATCQQGSNLPMAKAARKHRQRYEEVSSQKHPDDLLKPCIDSAPMNRLLESIYQELLPGLQVESIDPHNPVVVHQVPPPWRLLGTGNYAAVLYHPSYPDQVVKIYAPGRPGLADELKVYCRLGSHPAFSECLYAGADFLVLKRLYGATLYNCMHLGLRIPQQVIKDIDQALN